MLHRRDFHRLTAAAFGGAALGANLLLGAEDKAETSLLLQEPHVCRGLNTCKGVHAGVENACAGLGQCATAEHHECAGHNECKGQGGCGEHPGENACKGKGECAVPLSDDAWKTARKNFEAAMKKAGKKFGPAPKPIKK